MKTVAQQLNIKEFPFVIKDSNRKVIYYEHSNGFWIKREYDSNGKEIYYENSKGYWEKREYDSKGKQIYYEISDGYLEKCEYDSNGNCIYWENSTGIIVDNRPKPVKEMTVEQISKELGYEIKIVK